MNSVSVLTCECELCGKPVPVTNFALHQLRCRPPPPPQQQQKCATERGVAGNETDQNCNCDESFLSVTHPTAQWECGVCTYLNESSETSFEFGNPVCSMCHHENTWRGADERIFDSRKTDGFDEKRDFDKCSYDSDSDNGSVIGGEYDGCYVGGDADNGDDEWQTGDFSSWACSYCTTVNTACDLSCQVCDMPNSSTDTRGPDQPLTTAPTPSTPIQELMHTLEATVPALCYLGLTAGALMTDSSRGSSDRMRNGLVGSLVGTVAGMALAVAMVYEDDQEEEEQQVEQHAERDRSAAERLPVHIFHRRTASELDTGACNGLGWRGEGGEIDEDDDRASCRVCMELYQEGVEVKTLKCFHMFHATCIDQWLLRKTSCPLCCTTI